MSQQLCRQPIADGVHFSSITDIKFKHNLITVHFILPLSADTAADNAVVPYLLRKGCKACPDFSTLNARLCELYGASLDAGVSKYNGYQILEVSIRGLDDRFALEREDITGACARLLRDIVLEPNLDEKGLFLEKDLMLERQFLIDTIEAEINDKRAYALSRCLQEMCQGEPVAVRRYGTVASAKKITPQSAADAYRRMLKTAAVEIVFSGSGDPSSARDIFSQAFASLSRRPVDTALIRLRPKAERVREKVETMDLSQSKLVMGLRCGGLESLAEINAMRVCASMFGGTPFSKLFLNVREKLSLCYYCAARFDVSNRLMLVDSGVEEQNKEKAQAEILRQLKLLQQGEITDEELANTKLLLKNSITSTGDSLSSIAGWYMAQIMRGQSISPEEDAAALDGVTKEQVTKAAKAVTLDTVYFLTGGSAGKEEE